MQGIMFLEPMFLAAISGKKTQTRRIIFPDTDYTFWSEPSFEGMEENPSDVLHLDKNREVVCDRGGNEKLFKLKGTWGLFEGDQFEMDCSYVKPRYQLNKIVYLKEPYHIIRPNLHPEDEGCFYAFDFSSMKRAEMSDWSNKMFMPEKYARYFIQITDVTAQKLNNITEEEAIAEGFKNIAGFQNTWIKLHGFSSWPSNPWVWKYTFQLLLEL